MVASSVLQTGVKTVTWRLLLQCALIYSECCVAEAAIASMFLLVAHFEGSGLTICDHDFVVFCYPF